MMRSAFAVAMTVMLFSSANLFAQCPDPKPGHPQELNRGEAPIIFSQGHSGSSLRDGTVTNADDIILWVPAVDIIFGCDSNLVRLDLTGQFFVIWDSGTVGGNGNDDNNNEMRTLDFDESTGTFLIGYDDSQTEGFTDIDPIADGDLIRMTPTSTNNGFIDGFTLAREFSEGTSGTAGHLSSADLYGFALANDGTFYWGSGSLTLETVGGNFLSKASNDFVHTEGFVFGGAGPRNLTEDLFFDGSPLPGPGNVNPTFINGQSRGIEELDTGEILISVSDTLSQPNDTDTGVDVMLDRWDIGAIDTNGRMAEVVYPGELFFQTIDTANAEMLDFDVLNTPEEVNALIDVLGANSTAGFALRQYADPLPVSLGDSALMTVAQFDGQPTTIRALDPNSGAVIGTFVSRDFDNNGNLFSVSDIKAGPNRTVLIAQPTGDKIGQYNSDGQFIANYLSGQAVNNIRGMVRAQEGEDLFTADWTDDNIHRFRFFNGEPAPIAGDPLGEFIPGELAPPNLSRPQGIAILSNGDLLVSDVDEHKLKRYNSKTGALIGEFSSLTLLGSMPDVDVLPNGNVVVVHGANITTLDANGLQIGASIIFSQPDGVHVLPNGDYLVSSGATFGQGKGLFRVSPTGFILETIDNTRSYGTIELIDLVPISGDCELDDDLDLSDWPGLSVCIGGSDVPISVGCECADFDFDGDSDLIDFGLLQEASNP
ncbi:MAG: hypothetical protein DHS20C16_03950 [Phycisphaerae bacterium]|nr:MAG: hypothetical protein DHS20C16_03950 [Phycisphaerae bacterium]